MPSLTGRPSQIYEEGALNTVGIDIGVIGAGGPDRRISFALEPVSVEGWVAYQAEASQGRGSGRRRRQGDGARRLPSPRNGLASDAAIGNLSG